MKTFKNKKGSFYGIIVFLIAAFVAALNYSSCEVGLGGAVDIQSPTVSITYPPSLSIIRDSFVLAGTWKDDHSIKAVNIEVYKSSDSGKTLVHTQEAELSPDGTWSVNLNNFDNNNTSYYNGWQYADGDYEIQVQAEDNAKHTSGIASRTISIDNTAPVLVITNPTSAGSDSTPASFGQIVQLTGSFYDFCGKLSTLTVSFYDENGQQICDSNFTNITSMSDASPLVIARYYEDTAQQAENQKVYDNYCALLGASNLAAYQNNSDLPDTKIYFSITVSDEAKIYKTLGDSGVGEGNLSQKFYRGTTSMQNLVSGDGEIPDFSLAAFASYLNKTTDSYNSYSSNIETIARSAESSSTTTAATPDISADISNNDSSNGAPVYLTYTINPRNNPYYEISGSERVSAAEASQKPNEYSTAGYKKLYTGSPINVRISLGKDRKNISTSSVTIYRVDRDEYSGEITPAFFENKANYNQGKNFVVLRTWDSAVNQRFNDWGYPLQTSDYVQTSQDANVDSINESLTVSFSTAGHNYLLYVVGKDIAGKDIVAYNSKEYGFCGTTNTAAATFRNVEGNPLNDTVTLAKFKGTSATQQTDVLHLTGEIVTGETLNALAYLLTITDSNNNKKTATGNITMQASAAQANDYTSSYCYKATDSAEKVYKWRWTSAASTTTEINNFLNTPGAYEVTLVLTADNGASSTYQRTFTIDTQAPEIAAPEISPDVVCDTGGYWINPAKPFKVEGLVTDNLSTSKACTTWITLKALSKAENGTISEVTGTATGDFYTTETSPQTDVNKWTFTIPKEAIKKTYYGANLYVHTKDAAGNKAVRSPIPLVFDTVAPKGIHYIDYFNKDIVFRVNDFDNSKDDVDDTTGTVEYSTKLDTGVGGKYKKGSYSNTSTLKIRGYFEEEGSGVDMIYYKVFDHDPTPEEINDFETGYDTHSSPGFATGYFKPLAIDEIKQVMYQTGPNNSDWHAAKVKSSFKETISGLAHPNNYLVLLAVDKVGNLAVDSLEEKMITKPAAGKIDPVCEWTSDDGGNVTNTESSPWNGNLKGFSLNVDTESPILSCDQSGQQYTNGVSEITVTGSFTDSPDDACAGVSSIIVNVDGKESDADINYSEGSWAATISSDILKDLTSGKTYNVNGSIKDYAGNTSSSTLFQLSFDTEAPEVKLENPAANSAVNGTISISGSVDYKDSAPVKLELYAQTTIPSGELTGTPIKTITKASEIYSWKINDVNTYDLSGVTASATTKDLYIIPVVTDGAGNNNIYDLNNEEYTYTLGTNYFKYTVNMDKDRPTVKVTNLTLNDDGSYILKYGENAKIEGTISDDDATGTKVVKQFIASSSEIAAANITQDSQTKEYTITGATGITTYDQTTGEWTFTPAYTADGEKTVYFYIVDNADTLFYTGKTGPYKPYFQYKSQSPEDNATVITYNSDKTSPTISPLIQAYKSDGTTKSGDELSPGASVILGGIEKKYAQFIITGEDANGIKGLRMTLNYKDAADGSDKTEKISSIASYEGFAKSGTHSDTSTKSTWTTGLIDLSKMQTGSITGSIEVFDKSGLLGTSSPIFNVDNSGPGVLFTSPSSSDELTGDITFAGTASDEGGAGTLETAWLIPTKAQAAMSDSDLALAKDAQNKSIWNNTLDPDKSVGVWAFTVKAEDLDTYDNSTYTTTVANEIYTLPFYIKTSDKLGNTTIYKDFKFKHNPNADRPKTEIAYPNDKNYGTDNDGHKVQFVTLGGAIRISGSAVIPSNTTTVDSVYLQIVSGSGNLAGNQTINNKYTLTSDWAAAHGCTVMTKAQVQTAVGKTLTLADDFAWGIKADKTGSWNLTINEGGEMNPADDELTYIAIRACAVNVEGKVGTWTDWYYINIDNTAPSQKANLYQFTSAPAANDVVAATILASSNIKASQEYGGADIYLKGDWFLTIKMQDESEISSYTVTKKHGAVTTTLTSGQEDGYFVSTQTTENSKVTKYLFIPVDKNQDSVEYTVVVKDSEHTISSTYSLNIDNTAPSIEYIYKGNVLTEAQDNVLSNTSNTVSDSNYIYTLGGIIEETASGFERLAFYFVRDDNVIAGQTYSSNGKAVLDPLITSGPSDSKALISGLTKREFSQGSDKFYLYSKSVSGKLGADGLTFTPTAKADITGNAHIRVGGLIEAGGLLRKITEIDSSTGKVTFNTNTGITAETSATVYFPYAQIVDNNATEKVDSQSANPFTFKNNSDDGDGLPETLTGSKSVGFTWDATIHSSNIPDGPCALVVLAFDKAGNVSGKTFPVKVENSAPRLAKVWLGTDLNSSGTWSSDEFIGYNLYDANTTYGIQTTEVKKEQAISTANFGSVFTIKDKLAVVAEIVGGNGDIMMVYGKGAETTTAVPSSGTGAGITATPDNSINTFVSSGAIGSVTYNNATKNTSLKGYTLTSQQVVGLANNAAITESTDGTGKKASFTFWDHTDELAAGTTSQNCVLLINDFTIDLKDSVPPKVVVNPFYWESASNNSLYANSKANGHIELEKDLSGTVAESLYGADPKVSGKITFTGTAYDDHALKTLSFSLTDSEGTALTGFSNITMATYDPTSTNATYVANGGWSVLNGNSGAALTSTGKYEWAISTTAKDSQNRYYDDTCYLDQQGHKIYWTISIDTAQIQNAAHTDVKLIVTAKDLNGTSSAGATVTSTNPSAEKLDAKDNHVPTYQMDIVPYITKISTTVRTASGLKDNNIRSASGKYSILANNTSNIITVSGFNFATGNGKLVAKIANTATSGGTTITSTSGGTAVTIAATNTTTATITNSSITKSGYLELFSNGVRALNNINGNDSYGTAKDSSGVQLSGTNAAVSDYANAYNREPDYYTTKNVQLTDDRYLRFFDMKDTGKKNAYYPNMIMEGNDPVFGFVDLNGSTSTTYGNATVRSGYQPQRAKFSGTNGSQSSLEYLIGGLSWDQMAMAKDSTGKYLHTSVYNYSGASMSIVYNQYASQHTWSYTSGWNTYSYTGAWGTGTGYSAMYDRNNNPIIEVAEDTGNNAITIESVDFGEGTLIGRYQNIKMIAKGDSTSAAGASVYMAYYDDNTTNKDVIFRTFKIAKDNSLGNQLKDAGIYSNLGEQNTSGRIAVRPANNTTVKGSKYLDLGVTSDNHVVVVFYDMEEGKLRMYYSSGTINGSSITPTITWTAANVTFPSYVGTDVSMVIDGSNGIHITASDSTDSDLVYMYMPGYNSTTLKTIKVDQAFSVGTWTSIKVKGDATNGYIPYIAYYNATETGSRDPIKLAYFADTTKKVSTAAADTIQGVDSNGYTTGMWEYMTVPAITPPQGGDTKFRSVCLDFDNAGLPVVGYLGTNLEFGKWLGE